MGFGSDERDAKIEGIILVDLRMDVGSKKTTSDTVSLVARDGMDRTIPAFPSLLQCDTMSVMADVFKLPSIATRFGLYCSNRLVT